MSLRPWFFFLFNFRIMFFVSNFKGSVSITNMKFSTWQKSTIHPNYRGNYNCCLVILPGLRLALLGLYTSMGGSTRQEEGRCKGRTITEPNSIMTQGLQGGQFLCRSGCLQNESGFASPDDLVWLGSGNALPGRYGPPFATGAYPPNQTVHATLPKTNSNNY